MITKYSKESEKSVRKLSGKTLNSVRNTILEVKNASSLDEITDCKKFACLLEGGRRGFLQLCKVF